MKKKKVYRSGLGQDAGIAKGGLHNFCSFDTLLSIHI